MGSLTQLAHIRLGKRTEHRNPMIKELVPLTELDGMVFGGWDIFGGNVFDACETAQVLDGRLTAQLRSEREAIEVMPGAFDPSYVKRLNGTHIKPGGRRAWADALREDIRRFKAAHDLAECVLINCSSTEVYSEAGASRNSEGRPQSIGCEPAHPVERMEVGLRGR